MKKILIIGSGLAGSVFANLLAKTNKFEIKIIDKRNHIGGNCYTYKDQITGINIHAYGAHIFHTNDEYVWNFINKFTKFNDYKHKVKSNSFNKIYSLPINLHTINQYYGTIFNSKEAEEFIKKIANEDKKRFNIIEPKNFEEQAISMIGNSLYNVFFKFYTIKQWERDPKTLPASILKRLPLRFNYNDTYFHNAKFQGIPENGYTEIFEKLLDNKNIKIELNTNYLVYKNEKFDYIIYTGPIDEYYDYKFGKLEYRTIYFQNEIHDGDYQGTSVINYTDLDYPWTRIIEHKYFDTINKNKFKQTFISKEYSKEDDGTNPYYPIRDEKNLNIFRQYKSLADSEENTIFVGRLAQYQYYDMDQVIASTIKKFNEFIKDK